MNQATYSDICEEIRDDLYHKLERCDDVRLQFAPKGTAAAVLYRDNLVRWFRSLADDWLGVDENMFVDRVCSRQLHDFLAISIFAMQPVAAAKRLVTIFVASDSWPVTIPGHRTSDLARLPAKKAHLEYLFANESHVWQFESHQAIFCPIVLQRRAEVFVEHAEHQRLPYLLEQPLAEGSFGKVFKVRIAKGHFFDPSSRTSALYNDEPLELARKDYLVSSDFRAEDERDVMDRILGSHFRKPENVLENFGSLNTGHSTYSLFMPLAICDLRAYMMDLHKTQPTSLEAKADFVRSAVGLAEGLSFLHNDIHTEDLEELVCYHMDLKPDNILIFFERGRHVWKLSDFGMARIKIRHRSGQHREEEKDFNSWFVRRTKSNREPSTDPTVSRRGEGTYLAPESMSTNPNMNTSSDVWSLGCVLSVLFTYLDNGHEGVVAYQNARMRHASAVGYDRFFIATTSFSANKVHPEIDRWHRKLVKAAKYRSLQEEEAVSYALEQLETGVFKINPRARKSARDIVAVLKTTYKLMTGSQNDTAAEIRQKKIAVKGRWDWIVSKIPGIKRDTKLSHEVKAWRQRNLENYKGCTISRDGERIAYWSDIKISVFTSQSLPSPDEDEVSPSAEFTLPNQQCIWSSLSLVDRWLIASTSGANFQCYIFDLEGGLAAGASLERWIRLSLPEVPEIQSVNITPDDNRLICTLRHWTDDRSPGAIFHAGISELRRWSRGSVSARSSDSEVPSPWRIINIDWPAADITDLASSLDQDVYMVVQPELTYHTEGHRVSIRCLSLQTETYDTLNIEAQGLDTSTTVTLFTTFTLFNRTRAVAIVSREKRLLIQEMANNEQPPQRISNDNTQEQCSNTLQFQGLALPSSSDRRASDQSNYSANQPPTLARAMTTMTTAPPPQVNELQKEISRYRILRLMMSRDNRKIYCIGTANASHKLLLFTVDLPASAGEDVKVMELAQLGDLGYGDEFTAGLAEKGSAATTAADGSNNGYADQADSGTYVLVAALVGRGRKAIYRVPISDGAQS